MDYFAHMFWSYIFYHKTKKPIYAVLFGILPDSFSWLIFLFYNLFTRQQMGQPFVERIPQWVFTLYGISHSLIVFAVVLLVLYIISKKVPIYIFAWPIHIIMDIPTHTREFLPTPFLWPVSDWYFPGMSWGTSWFMILNYSLIVAFILIIYITRNGKKKKLENSD